MSEEIDYGELRRVVLENEKHARTTSCGISSQKYGMRSKNLTTSQLVDTSGQCDGW